MTVQNTGCCPCAISFNPLSSPVGAAAACLHQDARTEASRSHLPRVASLVQWQSPNWNPGQPETHPSLLFPRGVRGGAPEPGLHVEVRVG